jgi:FkbM family methyltransferase
MRRYVRRLLRSTGYDLTPHPLPDWVILRENTRQALNRWDINCVLDVGAHFGEYASLLRRSGYEEWIVSFEPVASSFDILQQQMGRDPKWRGYRVALAAANELRAIQVSAESAFTSFLQRSDYSAKNFGNQTKVVRTEMVEVKRLDSVFEACTAVVAQPRVFLKVDTQGFDLEVLEGTGRHLDRVLALQLELSVQGIYEGTVGYLEALERMTRMGFQVSAMVPVNRDSQGLVVEFDCIMARHRPDFRDRQPIG